MPSIFHLFWVGALWMTPRLAKVLAELWAWHRGDFGVWSSQAFLGMFPVAEGVWNTCNINFWETIYNIYNCGCSVHPFGGQKVALHTALVTGKAGLDHLWFVDAASCRHLRAWGTGGGYPLGSSNGNSETWKLRLYYIRLSTDG